MASAGSAEPKVIVIVGATVIDCTGRPPLIDGVVVIEGNKIKAVGRKGQLLPPPGARVIEASGKTVLPGLIDMHVHYREWQGELFLANGITTVKDLGNPVEWISELGRMQAGGTLRGPRIFYVGNNLDAPPPEGDHNVGITNASDAERAVRLLHRFGVIAIKVRHKITPELLGEVTRVAHAQGLPVTGHLARTNATEAALAGIDGLEHATGVARAAAEAPDEIKDAKGLRIFLEDLRGFALMSEEKEAALIKLLVLKHVRLIPTLSVRRRAILEDNGAGLMAEDGSYARNPELGYVPDAVRKEWMEAPLDRMIRDTFGKQEMLVMRKGYHRLEGFVREFRRAGGEVLAGSDNVAGVAGLTLLRELESLVAAGLTPMETLMAATRDAARFLQRNDLGTIEPGKTADLVVFGANPLDDMRNLHKVEKVIQNGQEVETAFHRGYPLPPARPQLVRPLLLERMLSGEKE
jgi:imidazolonepropionase-like amidohydrolase